MNYYVFVNEEVWMLDNKDGLAEEYMCDRAVEFPNIIYFVAE